MAEMATRTGSAPRRARHLIPAGLPRRAEVVAGCAVAIGVVHLLLAQLTLVLAVVFAVIGKSTRWRRSWLLVPTAVGLAWTLAMGPDKALAGFTAGPASILWHLSGGHPAGQAGHPFAGFGGIREWLPRQLPVALVTGAAEAALAGWLDWLHADEWALPPPRPGLAASARRALAASRIRSGAVVTRDGCALGVVASTGATAELRWAELVRGMLVVGCAQQDVSLTGLQVAYAALRRRKPVVVLDPGDPATARAVAAACRSAGAPLVTEGSADAPAGTVTGASGFWGRDRVSEPVALPSADGPWRAASPPVDLERVVRDRLAALLPAGSAELASRACACLTSLAAGLRRIGVDGDALVWVPRGELVPARALAALLRDGPGAGLSVLIGTTSPAAAAEVIGLAGTVLSYRVAERSLAGRLAARTGTRLLPAPLAAALAGQDPDAGEYPAAATSAGLSTVPPAVADVTVGGLVPSPVLPAPALLSLGQGEFVLAVSSPPGRRLVAAGRLVPARLPLRPR